MNKTVLQQKIRDQLDERFFPKTFCTVIAESLAHEHSVKDLRGLLDFIAFQRNQAEKLNNQ